MDSGQLQDQEETLAKGSHDGESRSFRYWMLAIIFVCCGCVSPILISPAQHRARLSSWEENYLDVRHPAETGAIRKISDYGLLMGNGNHCDYLAGEVRWSTMPIEELRDYYTHHQQAMSWIGEGESDFIDVETFEEIVENQSYTPQVAVITSQDQAKAREKGGFVYIVYAYHGGDDPGWDLRCS